MIYFANTTKEIVKEMVAYQKTITFRVENEDDLKAILDIVRYDNIVTFHVGTILYTFDEQRKSATIEPQYLYSKNNYDFLIKEILEKLNEIKVQINKLSTNLEKEFFIHDYLCKKVVYKDNGLNSHCILGPLLYGEGVCEGIAKTAQALFKIAKIESHIICGDAIDQYNNKIPHAWNTILINGRWYLLDITYDNTISNPDFIRYDFFNLSAKELETTHTPYSYCRSEFYNCINSYSYFLINNCYFLDAPSAFYYIKQTISKKREFLYFKCTDSSLSEQDVSECILRSRRVLSINYSSDKKTGIFYFHIKYKPFFI